MRATVFTDEALAKHAGRFVWLSIDTENEANGGFLGAYPWKAVPTFQIIEPAGGRVVYSWLGALDAARFAARLDEAERAIRTTPEAGAEPAAVDADALVAMAIAGRHDACAQRALAMLPALPKNAVRATVALTGLECALDADPAVTWRSAAIATLEGEVRAATTFDRLISDDRAALYAGLIGARRSQGDDAGAKVAAVDLLDFLDEDARSAPNPEARAALDGFRVSAALAAGDPGRVLAALEASERDLPADYNPPARLAVLFRELGRFDEALAASDRALATAYGPRKVSIYEARATILEKKGELLSARSTLEKALRYAVELPDARRSRDAIGRIEKRLADLSRPIPRGATAP